MYKIYPRMLALSLFNLKFRLAEIAAIPPTSIMREFIGGQKL